MVYDPFIGRGTTPLEAALLGRVPAGCDINPLSQVLVAPRLFPPAEADVLQRLEEIDLYRDVPVGDTEDLLVFYHPETLRVSPASGITCLPVSGKAHSTPSIGGFVWSPPTGLPATHRGFSVYTLPPNQATSAVAQRKINAKRNQTPPVRDIKKIIAKKSRALSSNVTAEERETLSEVRDGAEFVTNSCDATPDIAPNSISLVVTSPPFLDVVDLRDR